MKGQQAVNGQRMAVNGQCKGYTGLVDRRKPQVEVPPALSATSCVRGCFAAGVREVHACRTASQRRYLNCEGRWKHKAEGSVPHDEWD